MPVETLIAEVRSLIGDASDPPQFDAATVQLRLERTLDGVEVADAVDADYDVYAAGAELCEMWAVRLKDDVSFSDGGRRFELQQTRDSLRLRAQQLREQSPRGIGVGSLTNSDFNA
ncbi:MAG: hypothetical protein ABR603_01810 [Pyrinomonadaceae bacterium]